MKKIVLILSVMASVLALAGCAPYQGTHMDQGPGAQMATLKTGTAHHDYKGETK